VSLLRSETKEFLRGQVEGPVRAALILGSGLNPLVRELNLVQKIPYRSIPHFPVPTVPGHAGNFHVGTYRGLPLAVFEGRFHCYEGHSLWDVAAPVRAARVLGATTLVVTNAAGGIEEKLATGDIMLIRDHINLMGVNPLTGFSAGGKALFPDMSDVYTPSLRALAGEVLEAEEIRYREGVLAAMPGPCYETPAEVRMLKTLGADAVCMSTVPEVIMARSLAMEVLGISLITNPAAGLSETPLDHSDVIRTGKDQLPVLSLLVKGVLRRLAERC
jgi:purine-nucleoside phosphorylase